MFILVNNQTYSDIDNYLSRNTENRVKFVSFMHDQEYKGLVYKGNDGIILDDDGNILYDKEVFFQQYRSPHPDHKICTSSFFRR